MALAVVVVVGSAPGASGETVGRTDDGYVKGQQTECSEFLSAIPEFLGVSQGEDDPEWVWVDSDPADRFQSVAGVVGEASVTHTDFPAAHDSHDGHVRVKVDSGYEGLLSNSGYPNYAKKVFEEDVLLDPHTIKMEWEVGYRPLDVWLGKELPKVSGLIPYDHEVSEEWLGNPPEVYPADVWPSTGDRVWINGHWVFDCGHGVEVPEGAGNEDLYRRTEIHPGRAIASMRNQAEKLPGTGETPVDATVTDLYIHGRGGMATDIIYCGPWIMHPGNAPERGPDCDFEGHEWDRAHHRGTPINDDYEFSICLPSRPSDQAILVADVAETDRNTVDQPLEFELVDAEGRCEQEPPGVDLYQDEVLNVTVELSDVDAVTPDPEVSGGCSERGECVLPEDPAYDEVYAREIVAGWVSPPDPPLDHFKMELEEMRLTTDEDWAGDNCQCSFFWANINQAGGNEWIRLSAHAQGDMGDYEAYEGRLLEPGDQGYMEFSDAEFDFYARRSAPLRIQSEGWDQDCSEGYYGFHQEPQDFGSYCYKLGATSEGVIFAPPLAKELGERTEENDELSRIARHLTERSPTPPEVRLGGSSTHGSHGTGVAFGDVDGDGRDEVGITDEYIEGFQIHDDGWGIDQGVDGYELLYTGQIDWPPGVSATSIAFGDVDNDRYDEIGVTLNNTEGGASFILYDDAWAGYEPLYPPEPFGGDSDGEEGGSLFANEDDEDAGVSIAFGDIDDTDPREEVAVATKAGDGTRFFVLDDGENGFVRLLPESVQAEDLAGQAWEEGSYVTSLAFGDVDDDDRAELGVTMNMSEEDSSLFSDGDEDDGSQAMHFKIYDDRDAPSAFESMYEGGKTWGKTTAESIAFGDVDEDGTDEFAVALTSFGDSGLVVYDDQSEDFQRIHAQGNEFPSLLVASASVHAGGAPGDSEALIASREDGTLAWYDLSASAISRHPIDEEARGVTSMAAADIDGDESDGLFEPDPLDVVVGFDDGTLAWYENAGGGTFTRHPIPEDAGGAPVVATADVDGDEFVDVVVGSDDGTLAWYQNTETEDDPVGFDRQVIDEDLDGAPVVVTADVDGDEFVDVVVGSEDGTLAWYEKGPDTWTEHVIDEDLDGAPVVATADVNANEFVDVVVGSEDGTLAWYENGPDTWTEHVIDEVAGGAPLVATADVDGNEFVDVVVGSEDGTLVWYQNTKTDTMYENTGQDSEDTVDFERYPIDEDAGGASSMVAADADGDGDDDVLSSLEHDDVVVWYENNLQAPGNPGSFNRQQITETTKAPRSASQSVALGDVDGDGREEIALIFREADPDALGPERTFRLRILDNDPDVMGFVDLVDDSQNVIGSGKELRQSLPHTIAFGDATPHVEERLSYIGPNRFKVSAMDGEGELENVGPPAGWGSSDYWLRFSMESTSLDDVNKIDIEKDKSCNRKESMENDDDPMTQVWKCWINATNEGSWIPRGLTVKDDLDDGQNIDVDLPPPSFTISLSEEDEEYEYLPEEEESFNCLDYGQVHGGWFECYLHTIPKDGKSTIEYYMRVDLTDLDLLDAPPPRLVAENEVATCSRSYEMNCEPFEVFVTSTPKPDDGPTPTPGLIDLPWTTGSSPSLSFDTVIDGFSGGAGPVMADGGDAFAIDAERANGGPGGTVSGVIPVEEGPGGDLAPTRNGSLDLGSSSGVFHIEAQPLQDGEPIDATKDLWISVDRSTPKPFEVIIQDATVDHDLNRYTLDKTSATVAWENTVDAGSGVSAYRYALDGGRAIQFPAPEGEIVTGELDDLAEGIHRFQVTALDGAGNERISSVDFCVKTRAETSCGKRGLLKRGVAFPPGSEEHLMLVELPALVEEELGDRGEIPCETMGTCSMPRADSLMDGTVHVLVEGEKGTYAYKAEMDAGTITGFEVIDDPSSLDGEEADTRMTTTVQTIRNAKNSEEPRHAVTKALATGDLDIDPDGLTDSVLVGAGELASRAFDKFQEDPYDLDAGESRTTTIGGEPGELVGSEQNYAVFHPDDGDTPRVVDPSGVVVGQTTQGIQDLAAEPMPGSDWSPSENAGILDSGTLDRDEEGWP